MSPTLEPGHFDGTTFTPGLLNRRQCSWANGRPGSPPCRPAPVVLLLFYSFILLTGRQGSFSGGNTVSPSLFYLVQGKVGPFREGIDVVPIPVGRHAYAGRDRTEPPVVQAEQQHPQFPGEHERLFRVDRGGNDEFVAAPACHPIRGSNIVLDRLGYFLQAAVAGQVSLRVVEGLEVVQVDHDQRQGRPVPGGPGYLLPQVFVEELPVEEVRCHIRGGRGIEFPVQAPEFFFGFQAVRYFQAEPLVEKDLVGRALDIAGVILDPDYLPVFPFQAVCFEAVGELLVAEVPVDLFPFTFINVDVRGYEERAELLEAVVSEHADEGSVSVEEVPF